ncbi:nuclear transport factor 2 family protein [Echinicola jeungdonensis]|uniref:Nuclear transport factor 2 family protein n=1 Tax=Echinicola jeungdonensis TaxID=709343 RepID=A0ABV5J869_9BACT|nr:nuclear transport factor 2 family protein [Echinicola jeungdonensis]MDN3669913.1 nuclear transport factor 2 family protein [Echinicola jeungdonensis]
MKAKIFMLLIMVCFLIKPTCHAQSETSIDLVKAVQEFNQALIDANEEKLKKLTEKQLSYGHSNGNLENKETFLESLLSGKSDFVSIHLKNQKYEVVDNIGIARHLLFAETNDGGVAGKAKIGVMMIWRKNGDWKLLARQAYKLPEETTK